jgi:hypothetical protein
MDVGLHRRVLQNKKWSRPDDRRLALWRIL